MYGSTWNSNAHGHFDSGWSVGLGACTHRVNTLAEKLQILKVATAPGASVGSAARKFGMNGNSLFSWWRLHSKGLLEAQRHASPLLPVRLSSPNTRLSL